LAETKPFALEDIAATDKEHSNLEIVNATVPDEGSPTWEVPIDWAADKRAYQRLIASIIWFVELYFLWCDK